MQTSSRGPIIHMSRVVWVSRPFIICKKCNFRNMIGGWSMPYTSPPPFSLRSTEHNEPGTIFQHSALMVCCLINQILQTVRSLSVQSVKWTKQMENENWIKCNIFSTHWCDHYQISAHKPSAAWIQSTSSAPRDDNTCIRFMSLSQEGLKLIVL